MQPLGTAQPLFDAGSSSRRRGSPTLRFVGLGPQAAHEVPGGQLSALLRGAGPDIDPVDVRYAFAVYLAHQGHEHDTLAVAWNTFIGSTRTVRYRPARCVACGGTRRQPRTGGPCQACRGSGRSDDPITIRVQPWQAP